VLVERLQEAAARWRFDVVSLRVYRPLRAAPFVVVRADDEARLSAATPAIMRAIDPKRRTNDDRTGWTYEGFFFEARDRHGVPFLVVYNAERGPHAGGGQWAASERLFPYPHG
jgi:hypothetical protein